MISSDVWPTDKEPKPSRMSPLDRHEEYLEGRGGWGGVGAHAACKLLGDTEAAYHP